MGEFSEFSVGPDGRFYCEYCEFATPHGRNILRHIAKWHLGFLAVDETAVESGDGRDISFALSDLTLGDDEEE